MVCLNWLKILNDSDSLERSLMSVQLCWQAVMRSATSVLYFIILQILWTFRSLYDAVVPEKCISKEGSADPENKASQLQDLYDSGTERRHLIHLFTSNPKEHNGRPVCYMDVCEIITPQEEEMLRCTCAKGVSKSVSETRVGGRFPPTSGISRESFTNVWMDSFSLVI